MNKYLNAFSDGVPNEELQKFAATASKRGADDKVHRAFSNVPFDNDIQDRLTLQAEVVYAICDCTITGYLLKSVAITMPICIFVALNRDPGCFNKHKVDTRHLHWRTRSAGGCDIQDYYK